MEKIEKIKAPLNVMSIAFAISFLFGMFSWEMPEGFLMVIGFIELACLIWMLAIVYKKSQ